MSTKHVFSKPSLPTHQEILEMPAELQLVTRGETKLDLPRNMFSVKVCTQEEHVAVTLNGSFGGVVSFLQEFLDKKTTDEKENDEPCEAIILISYDWCSLFPKNEAFDMQSFFPTVNFRGVHFALMEFKDKVESCYFSRDFGSSFSITTPRIQILLNDISKREDCLFLPDTVKKIISWVPIFAVQENETIEAVAQHTT